MESMRLLKRDLGLKLQDGRSARIDVQSVDPNARWARLTGLGEPPVMTVGAA